MNPVDLLNAWGASWFGFMSRALIDASLLLAVILVVWLPMRRRVSAQLAHGLFCLVLLKLIVPVPVEWSWWQSLTRSRPAAPAPPAVVNAEPLARIILPTTGDVGANLVDASVLEPVAIVEPAQDATQSGVMAGSSAKTARLALSLQAWLMLGWASIVVLLLARFLRATRTTRRLIREAVPLRPEWLPIDVQALPSALGLRRPCGGPSATSSTRPPSAAWFAPP